MPLRHVLLILLLLLGADSAWAGEFDFSGSVAGEGRFFFQDPQFAGQKDDPQLSLILTPEFRYRSDEGQDKFSLIPFFRLDSLDDERSHFDLREAYWLHMGEAWDVLIGVNKVFWGVAESRHLVDIINQTDLVENIDGEDKLGQPMLNLTTMRDWGTVNLFVLPGFRERTFPGRQGRLRLSMPVDQDAAEYESGAEEWHVDYAARYSHFVGGWDFGGYYFYGTSREPRLLPNAAGTRLVPYYDLIHQVGLDVQYTRDAWLWKFEGLVRDGEHGETFPALVGGFEYTLFQLVGAADLGLLLEYNFDDRDSDAPPTIFDNDIFVGTRLTLNDMQDTNALIGAIIDQDDQSTLLYIEAERRLGDKWSLEIETRLFINTEEDDLAHAFRKDDFFTLRLSYFY